MSEIPEDIMDVAFALTAGDWNQPHDVRAKKVASAIAAERERCADYVDRYLMLQTGLGVEHIVGLCSDIRAGSEPSE